jgi:predicted methyltransferase
MHDSGPKAHANVHHVDLRYHLHDSGPEAHANELDVQEFREPILRLLSPQSTLFHTSKRCHLTSHGNLIQTNHAYNLKREAERSKIWHVLKGEHA